MYGIQRVMWYRGKHASSHAVHVDSTHPIIPSLDPHSRPKILASYRYNKPKWTIFSTPPNKPHSPLSSSYAPNRACSLSQSNLVSVTGMYLKGWMMMLLCCRLHTSPSQTRVCPLIDWWLVIRRFLQARKFNPADALEQYGEARAFHAEKGILSLYDSIGVKDYEDTRRLVFPVLLVFLSLSLSLFFSNTKY